jgi:hypothetical protein
VSGVAIPNHRQRQPNWVIWLRNARIALIVFQHVRGMPCNKEMAGLMYRCFIAMVVAIALPIALKTP